MKRIRDLLAKYKSVIAYLFFGVCTTAVNVIVYDICYHRIQMANVPATVVAWVLAVLFAYITNKLFVFDSRSFAPSLLKKEIPAFFGCRLLTGVLDVVIMYLAVDCMHWNSTLWKLISNILVILLNYVASKTVIFRKE